MGPAPLRLGSRIGWLLGLDNGGMGNKPERHDCRKVNLHSTCWTFLCTARRKRQLLTLTVDHTCTWTGLLLPCIASVFEGQAVKIHSGLAPHRTNLCFVTLSQGNVSLTSIYDDELCKEDGDGQCQPFKAGFTFFFLQAFFGIIAGAKVIGDAHFDHKVPSDEQQTPAGRSRAAVPGPCCKKSASADGEIEMTETSGEESRDAITGI